MVKTDVKGRNTQGVKTMATKGQRVSPELKARILKEIGEGKSKRDAAKEYGIHPMTIYKWGRKTKTISQAKKKPTKTNISYSVDDCLRLIGQQFIKISELEKEVDRLKSK